MIASFEWDFSSLLCSLKRSELCGTFATGQWCKFVKVDQSWTQYRICLLSWNQFAVTQLKRVYFGPKCHSCKCWWHGALTVLRLRSRFLLFSIYYYSYVSLQAYMSSEMCLHVVGLPQNVTSTVSTSVFNLLKSWPECRHALSCVPALINKGIASAPQFMHRFSH